MQLEKYQNSWQRFKYSKLFRLPMWILRKIQFRSVDPNKEYTVGMRLGHQISLRPTESYLSLILRNRSYHDADVYFVEKFMEEGSVILDIGANIGLYTCAFANKYKAQNVQVYAIEAVQKNFDFLDKNIKLNNLTNALPFRVAFGEEKGEITFFLPSEDYVGNLAGGNILSSEEKEKIKNDGGVEEVVPMTTLDAWAEENQVTRCDYLKIDIEGAEMFAFKGGRNFIKKTRPLIQCEYNKFWLNKMEVSLKDFFDFFKELDYEIFVEEGDVFKKLENDNLDVHLIDLLFIPKEKQSKIRG